MGVLKQERIGKTAELGLFSIIALEALQNMEFSNIIALARHKTLDLLATFMAAKRKTVLTPLLADNGCLTGIVQNTITVFILDEYNFLEVTVTITGKFSGI